MTERTSSIHLMTDAEIDAISGGLTHAGKILGTAGMGALAVGLAVSGAWIPCAVAGAGMFAISLMRSH